MNPSQRFNWPLAWKELREWITAIPEAHQADDDAICDGCGSRLFIVRGRHSGKFFYSHEGVSRREGVRAIFFDTKEAALAAEIIFL